MFYNGLNLNETFIVRTTILWRVFMFMLKMAILSISVLTTMAGAAVTPAIGDIALAFPNSSSTLIKMILTIPALFIIPFTFVTNQLTKRLSKKTLLIWGIVLYLIGGTGGGFAPNITLLLTFRAVLGMGVGIMMPLSISIVSDFFQDEEKTKMMGRVSSANQLGGIIAVLLAGWLSSLLWRYAFAVYLIGLIVMVLIIFFLPHPVLKSDLKNKQQKMPFAVYKASGAMFLVMIVFYALPTNISLYIQQTGMGDASDSGVMMALMSATGIVSGLIVYHVKWFLKTYFILIQITLAAGGYIMISISNHLILLGIGIVFIGFGITSIIPIIFDYVTNNVTPSQSVKATAFVTIMLFLGQFLSPIILDYINKWIGNGSIQFTYRLLGIASACLASINLMHHTGKTVLHKKGP